LANSTAEAVLRAIYGDDFAGCTIRLETIAAIIHDALEAQTAVDRGLLDLYEKTNEALLVLTNPPANVRDLAPPELQSLLGDRLDTIRTLAEKVATVTAKAKESPESPEGGE